MSDRIRLSMKDVNQYNGREFNKKDSKLQMINEQTPEQ